MTARINDFRAAVVAVFKEKMPALKSCEEQFGRFVLEELEREMFHCPAVRFAVLRAIITPEPSAQPSAELECAAFVVTDGSKRDASAWAVAEAIATMLTPDQRFGLTKIAEPRDVRILPVIAGALKSRNVSVIAVEWKQTLRQLGEAIWDDEKHLLEELYINDELTDLSEAEAPA